MLRTQENYKSKSKRLIYDMIKFHVNVQLNKELLGLFPSYNILIKNVQRGKRFGNDEAQS